MEMQMEFIRKLPIPKELKEQYPIDDKLKKIKEDRDVEIKNIFEGKDNRFLLIIGPCSADREDAVLEYMTKLRDVQEKVKDKIFIIPRVYTNKPRTNGTGYKGMLHQPNPEGEEDMLAGIIAIREMHTRVIKETGFTCAEEMLYPENHRYLSDLLAYVAIGARSVEDQQHRIVSSGLGVPVGMKNPIYAAQNSQKFIYRGWEVKTPGNPLTHAILRGYVDSFGRSHANYHYEDLNNLLKQYDNMPHLVNPAVIVDTNHANSGKQFMEQIRIANDVIHSMHVSNDIRKLVKGLMIESYLVDGCQKIGEGVYGKSITDPCLGWEKSEALILDLAEKL